MTKVGFVGLGKLGLPCAAALGAAGHDVVGFDVDPRVAGYIDQGRVPYREQCVEDTLRRSSLRWAPSVDDVVEHAEVVFIAAQTPHEPRFEGVDLLDDDRVDFEYGYLAQAFRSVAAAAARQAKPTTVAVVSTVLPGTVNRVIRPASNGFVSLVYNPFFIAMGTTIPDFTRPEFVLLGVDDEAAADQLADVYRRVHDAPTFRCSVETAELVKVAYNAFIGVKIVFANAMMEICQHTGADVDDVTDALALATDRLISAKYLRAGMGDGGGCHPRDHLAMSWLARRHGLSFDLFGTVMEAREAQTGWIADHVAHWQQLTGMPVVVLGKAYKPDTNLTVGSPALLLARMLDERGVRFGHRDHHVDDPPAEPVTRPCVFVIATRHPEYPSRRWPAGSVVIDPWGYVPDQAGVTVLRLGRPGPSP